LSSVDQMKLSCLSWLTNFVVFALNMPVLHTCSLWQLAAFRPMILFTAMTLPIKFVNVWNYWILTGCHLFRCHLECTMSALVLTWQVPSLSWLHDLALTQLYALSGSALEPQLHALAGSASGLRIGTTTCLGWLRFRTWCWLNYMPWLV